MRIVIVAEVFIPKIDGVVIRTMQLIRQLHAHGDEIMVVCPQVPEARESPVKLLEFPSFPLPNYPEYHIGIPDDTLGKAIVDFAPDVIHYLNPFAFGFQCFNIIKRAGIEVPSVFSFHTLYGDFVRTYPFMSPLSRLVWWLMRDYHNSADTNLTVSAAMQAELIARGFERVALWPPAVDSNLFHPRRASLSMRNRLSAGHPDEPLILTVSRLAPEKNVGFIADVLRQVPATRLAIIGDGPHRCELERRFAGTKTNFLGYLNGKELAAAYASADLFLYASETETMGNVILEAMASGLCVIAPRAGGIPSLVDEGRTGLLFDPGNLPEAVSHVSNLDSHPERLKRMGQAAFTEVTDWTWARSIEKVRECYTTTIEQYHSADKQGYRQHWMAPKLTNFLVRATKVLSARNGPEASAVTSPLRVTS